MMTPLNINWKTNLLSLKRRYIIASFLQMSKVQIPKRNIFKTFPSDRTCSFIYQGTCGQGPEPPPDFCIHTIHGSCDERYIFLHFTIWMFPKLVIPPNHPVSIGFSIIFTIHFDVPLFLETP